MESLCSPQKESEVGLAVLRISFCATICYGFLHPSIKLVLRPIFRWRIILREISIPIQANIIRINTIDNSRLRIPLQKLSTCLSEGREPADEIKHMPLGSRFLAISSAKKSEPEL
jgi:hypothetical protein